MSNLESRTNIILFGPHNALSRCNISKQETSWGSENTMKIPYSTHIYRFFLIPILYNVLGHSVFCAVCFFLMFAQWTVFPNAVIVRWQTFRIKEKEFQLVLLYFMKEIRQMFVQVSLRGDTMLHLSMVALKVILCQLWLLPSTVAA